MMIRRNHDEKGASIAEAVTGLVVLVPIVLILIDISAIVLTQTANDDLAKHAARLAAGQSTAQLRQAAATSVVNNYPPSTMCSNPSLVSYSEPNNAQQVKVSTSMVCNLPVQVPFGGPTQQQFTAFATEPIVSSLQTANTGNAAPAVGTNSWGQQDDLGYVNVHLQTGQGGDPQAIGPLIPNVGEFQGSSGTTGGWNGGGSGTSSNSGSGSGSASGSGSSGPIQVGPIKGSGSSSSGSGSSSSGSGSSSSGSGSSSSGSGSSGSGSSGSGSSGSGSSGSGSSGSGSSSSGSGSSSSGSGSLGSGNSSTSSGPIP